MQPASVQLLEEEQPADWLRTMVVDFTPDREILLSIPTEGDGQVEIRPGTVVRVKVNLADGVREFTSKVLSREALHGGVLRLRWPTDTVRIQRRDFVRVSMTLPVAVTYEAEGEAPRVIEALTVDLSAGGVRLNLPEALPAETEVGLEIRAEQKPPYRVRGRIVHAGEVGEHVEPKRFWAAVQFLDVSESLRNDITQYVFDVQREQIRRSLT